MPYEYLDHQADIGLRGIGATPEEALAEGARAMLHLMVDPQTVALKAEVPVRCQADDLESLFVALLNELLYLREVESITLVDVDITTLAQTIDGWALEGVARGEPFDPDKHAFFTEVKAATYFGLAYQRLAGRHMFQCVVDV
ncbi:MAG: archease [Chloroflexota bacterium]